MSKIIMKQKIGVLIMCAYVYIHTPLVGHVSNLMKCEKRANHSVYITSVSLAIPWIKNSGKISISTVLCVEFCVNISSVFSGLTRKHQRNVSHQSGIKHIRLGGILSERRNANIC